MGTAIFSAIFASSAVAGCGDLSSLQGPFQLVDPKIEAQALVRRVANANFDERGGPPNASITGMWRFQMISKGNTGHVPSIPDGALIDFGYAHWHSDGTEVVNSGGHSPASANWCMGVWAPTGFLTYEINHFPIAYNPTTGEIANYINFGGQITLSPSGDSYTGTFTLDVYDPKGNHVDHLAGTMVAGADYGGLHPANFDSEQSVRSGGVSDAPGRPGAQRAKTPRSQRYDQSERVCIL